MKRLSKLLMPLVCTFALGTFWATNSLADTPVNSKLAKEVAKILYDGVKKDYKEFNKTVLSSEGYGAGAIYAFGTKEELINCVDLNNTRIFVQFLDGNKKQAIKIYATSSTLKGFVEITNYYMTNVIDKCDALNAENCARLHNIALSCVKETYLENHREFKIG